MYKSQSALGRFFEVAINKQTYINILYLLLSFPLGIFYFVYLTTGLSLGVGLAVIFVGFPILMFMIWSAKGLMTFERRMAEVMLGIHIDEPLNSSNMNVGPVKRFFLEIGNPDNWKNMIYLFLKFALGIFSFTVCVSLISTSLALFSAPFLYQIFIEYFGNEFYIAYNSPSVYLGFNITPFQESLICMAIGFFLGIFTLHLINGITYVSAKFLYFMSPVVRRIPQNTAAQKQ
ncbi:MAG: sensor domain-containing protein [Bacillota bacterium]